MSEPRPKRARAAVAAALRPAGAAAAVAGLDGPALTQAIGQLMKPLAALALAHGVPFASLEDMLKTALVDEVRAAHPNLPGHRMVSRVSAATGINRREVTRITQARSEEQPAPHRSPATRVFTRWLADPALKNRKGEALALARQGPAPSFEALAQSVTRDVHPRSLLDELCRLGLARVDGDMVHLQQTSFVPRGDRDRLLGFLGSNVGDHLRAAVANVLSDTPRHLEQAVFADELSTESLEDFDRLLRAQWQALLAATVPALQGLIDADRAAGRTQDQRVRIGLYSYHATMPTSAAPAPDTETPPVARRRAARHPTEK
jgi:hypothetical protein